MRHLVEHLVVPVVRVDRHDAAAEPVQREIVEEELRPVLQQQRDAVAVAVAGSAVTRAEAPHLGQRLPVRELDAARMVGAAGRGRRAQKRVVGRGVGRRHERVEHGVHDRAPVSQNTNTPLPVVCVSNSR